jgi:heme A synthase
VSVDVGMTRTLYVWIRFLVCIVFLGRTVAVITAGFSKSAWPSRYDVIVQGPRAVCIHE